LKVILDTWNNCGAPNPELQIYNGLGYNECAAGIFKVDNLTGILDFVRDNAYQPAKITYDNGIIEFYINNILYLSVFSPVTFPGYMGFTASTGGATDQHSIKNVIIHTEQAESDAGPAAISTCSHVPVQIGVANNPLYEYSWSPTTGLNNPNISDPVLTLSNSTGAPIVQTYTVTTTLASSPGVCPNSDSIDVTIHSTSDNTLVVEQCGGDYFFNGTTYDQSGIYSANYLSMYDCDSSVTLDLTIWNDPVISVDDETICLNDEVVLQATGALTYSWTPALPGAGTDGNLTVSPASTTVYSVTGTDANGCQESASATVTVNSLPMVIADASPASVCFGDAVALSASGGVTYSWTGSSLSDPTAQNQTIQPLNSGSYEVTGTGGNGCENSDIVNVTVNPLPIVQINASPVELCAGDSATLAATGANSYVWSGNGINNPNNSIQTVFPNTTQNYLVTGTSLLGCIDTAIVSITTNPLPVLSITPNQDICSGDSAYIFVQGAAAYEWSPFVPDQDNMQQAIVQPASTTTYTVTGTDLNGCISSINTTVNVLSPPNVDFFMSPYELDVFQNTTTQFINSSWNAVSYFWDFGDGETSTEESPSHSYEVESAGSFSITLFAYNDLGCVDSINHTINVTNGLVYYIPNTFTPDGDMFNQSFKPVFSNGFDPYNFNMQIYDRWGELIYETKDPDYGWDGTYANNRLVPDGTYNYVINYKIPNNDYRGYIYGHINVIR